MSNPIRLLLIDDHTLFRESLARLLDAEADLQVVGHHASIAQAMQSLTSARADVILLDYDLGEECGTDLLSHARVGKSGARVLVVTAGMRESATMAALSNGVAGVVYKHSGPGQLIEAIRKVASGEVWLDTGLMRALIAQAGGRTAPSQSARSLSERQHQVLRCILDGLTNKEIAFRLQVSDTSIKAVIQELFNKAGVRTRSQLVRIAIEKYSVEWLDSR